MQSPVYISTIHPHFSTILQSSKHFIHPMMKTALIFLLFALFSTQTLALVDDEKVVDMYGHLLVPGMPYHILDATNTARGIQTELTRDDTSCPVSVIIGDDAKKVIFHSENKHAEHIKLGETLDIEFAEVSYCARSGHWSVEIHGNKEYPVVIGPPESSTTMEGVFHITKSKDLAHNEYYIAFKMYGIDDYVLTASPYRPNQDFYRVEFCPEKTDQKFKVVFEPYKKPVPPPTPSPPPAPAPAPVPPAPAPVPPAPVPPAPVPPAPVPPAPAPPAPVPPAPAPGAASAFVPLIRKIVR